MAEVSESFKILIGQISSRLDSDGRDLRSVRDNINGLRDLIDTKSEAILKRLEEYRDMSAKAHSDYDSRLTIIESEKGIFGKAIGYIIAFVAGIGGGWFGKHL